MQRQTCVVLGVGPAAIRRSVYVVIVLVHRVCVAVLVHIYRITRIPYTLCHVTYTYMYTRVYKFTYTYMHISMCNIHTDIHIYKELSGRVPR